MTLTQALIITTFGGRSTRPMLVAMLRLGCVLALSLFLGFVMSTIARTIALPVSGRQYPLFFSVIFMMQASLLLSIISASSILRQRHSTRQLIRYLPLSMMQRWFTTMFPAFILCGCTLFLIAPLLYVLGSRLGLGILQYSVALLLSSIVSLGWVYGTPAKPLLKWSSIVVAIGIEYVCLMRINDTMSTRLEYIFSYAVLEVLLVISCWLFVRSFAAAPAYLADDSRSQSIRLYGGNSQFWFLKKCIRSKGFVLSSIATITMAGLTAGIGLKTSLLDTGTAASIASLLAAAWCTDIRATSRKMIPPEIASIKGTYYFSLHYLFWSLLGALLLTSPLLIYIAAVLTPTTMVLGAALSQVLLGAAIGIAVGAIIVPVRQDVVAQCGATLVCISILMCLDRLNLWPHVATLGNFVLVAICCATSALVERKRNPFVWRVYESTK